MDLRQLEYIIEQAFDKRDAIGVETGGEVRDAVGNLESEDKGTTRAAGIIGGARHFAEKGVFCGADLEVL